MVASGRINSENADLRSEIISFVPFEFSYAAYLGGHHHEGVSVITSPSQDLNDNKWHNVTLTRYGRKSVLSVDKISTSNIVQGDYKDLMLDDVLYVGGMTQKISQHYHVTRTKNFRGCLEDVWYGSTDIVLGAQTLAQGFATHGNVSFECRAKANRIISSVNPNLSVKISSPGMSRVTDFFTASFQFRTHCKDGLLISAITPKLKLTLMLLNGVLAYDVTDMNNTKTELTLGSNLGDGEWHQLAATLAGSTFHLGIDGQEIKNSLNYSLMLLRSINKFRPKIFLGKEGKLSETSGTIPGFVGCLLDLKIQKRDISFKDLKKNRNVLSAVRKSCHLENRCEPNPCRNGGKCSQDWKQFFCNCEHTQFEGKICDISLYKSTCEYYKSMGLQKDTFCLLDSLGTGNPYTALCNVTDPSRTSTFITHNKMPGTPVRDANVVGHFYEHEVTYTGSADMSQIRALVEKSQHCRQYIRFHCMRSKLLNTPRGPTHTFWLSHDGSPQEYWGGAEPGSKSCACGMAKPPSCAGPTKFCNCDARDGVWRVDDGYLTDKTVLPVTSLLFNRKSKRSDFTLGPLECWGNLNKQSVQRVEKTLKQEQMGYRLMKACPQVTKLKKSYQEDLESAQVFTTPQAPKNMSCRTENTTLSHQCLNVFNSVENITIITEIEEQRNFSQNSSETNQDGTSASREEDKKKTGLSTSAIVVISVASSTVIFLFIVLDRISRKYKSLFTCKRLGTPKIQV